MTSVSVAEAALLRDAQAGIRALVMADLDDWWSLQDFRYPDRVAAGLMDFSQVLVARYGTDAGQLAAQWYDDIRSGLRVTGAFRAEAVASPFLGPAVEGVVRRAAGALWTTSVIDTLVTIRAFIPTYVTAAANETIRTSAIADPKATGWQRVTRADACKFCVALSDRGAVYKRETATFLSHHSCGCSAVPSWDPHARPVSAEAYQASTRTDGYSVQTRQRLARRGYTPEQIDQLERDATERQRQRTRDWIAGL
jgi:hypothetical protein